jgi:hypothetical protein
MSNDNKQFILHRLSKETHCLQHFRVGYALLPSAKTAQQLGISQLEAGGQLAIKQEGSTADADKAAGEGLVGVIQLLRSYDVPCSSFEAFMAARNGHLAIIQDLRAHGIHCRGNAAYYAARNGDLEMLQDLQTHGLHVTDNVSMFAAMFGHLHIIHCLRANGLEISPLLLRGQQRTGKCT